MSNLAILSHLYPSHHESLDVISNENQLIGSEFDPENNIFLQNLMDVENANLENSQIDNLKGILERIEGHALQEVDVQTIKNNENKDEPFQQSEKVIEPLEREKYLSNESSRTLFKDPKELITNDKVIKLTKEGAEPSKDHNFIYDLLGKKERNAPVLKARNLVKVFEKYINPVKENKLAGIRNFQSQQEVKFIAPEVEPKNDLNENPVIKFKDFLSNIIQNEIKPVIQNVRQSEVKQFSLDGLNGIQLSDTNQIIEKISHYISQNSLTGMKEIDLQVNHHEIGNFKINAIKDLNSPNIQLIITVYSQDGAGFFEANQTKLLVSMIQKGIQVQDFKLEQNFDMERNNHGYANSDKEDGFSSRERDTERRRELWKKFNEEVA